jgi:hypothetical protein
MVDPALKGLYPWKSLSRFADAIALCVQVNTIHPPSTVGCSTPSQPVKVSDARFAIAAATWSTARAGVPAADVGGRAVPGPPGAESKHDEGARDSLAGGQRIRGLRVLRKRWMELYIRV